MTTRRTVLVAATSASMALALTSAPGAPAPPDGQDDHVRSASMEWVANLQYPVTDNNSQAGTTDVQGGTDLEVVGLWGDHDDDGRRTKRDYALAGTYENGFQVVDVTDPTQPTLAATLDCDVYQGDVQFWKLGRAQYAAYGVDYSAELDSDCYQQLPPDQLAAAEAAAGVGALVFDLHEPTAPAPVAFVPTDGGTHNATVRTFDVDGDGFRESTYLYNSENDAGGSLTVWDVTDVAAPERVAALSLADAGADTHDVTFSADGTRAYVASINLSYVLDTTDPAAPRLLGRIVDPAIGFHHQADPITIDGSTYVLISDEIAGAAGNGFCPGGGIHVWDVTDPSLPVKVGAYFMPDVTVQEGAGTGAAGLVSCTAHVYRLHPDQGIMTIGNMAGGVRVVDVSSVAGVAVGTDNVSTGEIAGMRDLGWFRFTATDTTGSDSWTFKAHPDRFEEDGSFHGFSNDQTRGFEVFRYDASAGAMPAVGSAERGTWLSPAGALRRAQQLRATLDPSALVFSCAVPGGVREPVAAATAWASLLP